MKKVRLIGASTFVLACLLSCADGARVNAPESAEECVMQFLQCLKNNDDERGGELSVQLTDMGSTFDIAKKYNPNWEPEDVSLSTLREHKNIKDSIAMELGRPITEIHKDGNYSNIYNSNELEIVRGQYNKNEAMFYVFYDSLNNTHQVEDFKDFLNITTSNGIKIIKGTNCTDIQFLQYSNSYTDDIVSCVNEFIKSVYSGSPSFALYPDAEKFEKYITIGSIAKTDSITGTDSDSIVKTETIVPEIQSVTINFKNDLTRIHEDGRRYNTQWTVQCSEGKTFFVQSNFDDFYGNTYHKIINSVGMYDFEKT